MPPTIRLATPGDAEAIARVQVDTWRASYAGIVPQDHLDGLSYDQRAEVWRGVAGRRGGPVCLWVAQDEDEGVVGFASGGPEGLALPAYSGEMSAIYIRSEHQRRGIGRALAAAVAGWLAEHGHGSLAVWVLAANAPARAFYEGLGGELAGQKPLVVGGRELPLVGYGWSDIHGLIERCGAAPRERGEAADG